MISAHPWRSLSAARVLNRCCFSPLSPCGRGEQEEARWRRTAALTGTCLSGRSSAAPSAWRSPGNGIHTDALPVVRLVLLIIGQFVGPERPGANAGGVDQVAGEQVLGGHQD